MSFRDGTGDQNRTREIATEAVNSGVPCDPATAVGEQTCTVECPGKILLFAVHNYLANTLSFGQIFHLNGPK